MKASEPVTVMEPCTASRSAKPCTRPSPAALNQSAVYSTPARGVKPATTASASAQPGTILGFTKLATWMRLAPVAERASIRAILSAVGMGPGSI